MTYRESFPPGTLLNTDDPTTPWNDDDTKWFRLDTVRVPVNGPINHDVEVTLLDHAEEGATLFVAADDGAPMLSLVGEDGPSEGPLRVSWEARHGQHFFVTVQRRMTAGSPLSFDIKTSVTLLLGGTFGMPQLLCEDETSGWGSDDIAAKLAADGTLVRAISNAEIGDMDQDDVRDLGQWMPVHVAYTSNAEITVIEEDWRSPDDVGSKVIPVLPDGALPLGGIAPGVRVHVANPDQPAWVVVSVDVDDGRYELRCTLTRWHEQA